MEEPIESRVLVATDLSAPADEAIRQAERWASMTQGALEVCSVLPAPAGGEPGRDLELRTFDVAERVSRLTGRAFGQFEVWVGQGEPAERIAARAGSVEASRLVVGSRGLHGLSRLMLGSVAERVVRLAPCPVLVARPDSGLHHIVVGTDFSQPAMPALQAAADEGRWFGVPVTILHCLERSGTTASGVERRQLAQDMLTDLAHRLGMAGEVRVTEGAPAAQLIRAAGELGADLIVVATVGRTGYRRLVLGSVAEETVREAPCSVLVVRKPPEEEARPQHGPGPVLPELGAGPNY